MLAHPFFADINLNLLEKKLLQAPYVPVIPDLEKLRQLGTQLTFKDFQETIIPTQKMELVNFKKDQFDEFGEINEISIPKSEKTTLSDQ